MRLLINQCIMDIWVCYNSDVNTCFCEVKVIGSLSYLLVTWKVSGRDSSDIKHVNYYQLSFIIP